MRHSCKDDDLAARTLYQPPFSLVDRVDRVVTAFRIDVRLGDRKEAHRSSLRKNANSIDTLQSGKDSGPVAFVHNRTFVTFQFAHTRVAVDAHEQKVAVLPRRI